MSQAFDSAPSSAPRRLLTQLALFTLALAFSTHANATIKINGVDRASNITGLGTATVVIYGGLAGPVCGSASDATCSSCTPTGQTGDNGLLPCNDARINGNLVLRISITSDSQATGYPVIMSGSTTSGATATPLNDTTPGQVSKGNPGTIEVTWSKLCNLMTTTSSTGTGSGTQPTNCVLPTGADTASAVFNVGMKSVNDTGAFASGDDYAQITIKIVAGPDSSVKSLADTATSDISYFEMASGDNRGYVKKLSCAITSFPQGTNVRFKWVRVLFQPRADGNSSSGQAWDSIDRSSPHTDLEISSTGDCSSGLDVSPISITGGSKVAADSSMTNVSIENDKVYDVKLAVVDEARNAYYYTAQADNEDCELADGTKNPASRSPVTGYYECHTIRPSEVVGILANKTNCFVATASYGSPMAKEVDTFRHFRDTYMIPTKLGLKFVRWYYREGPKYAHFIAKSDTYRAVARGFLWLPLQFAKISLLYGLGVGLMFLFTILIAPLALLGWMLKQRRSASTDA